MNEKLMTLKEAIKIKRWEWIPIIGTFVYSLRINIVKLKLENKQISYLVSIGLGKVQWPFLLISLSFMITFFVIRDKYGFGHWPWVFWVGIGAGVGQLTTPLLHYLSLKGTINKFEKNNHANKDEKKLTK